MLPFQKAFCGWFFAAAPLVSCGGNRQLTIDSWRIQTDNAEVVVEADASFEAPLIRIKAPSSSVGGENVGTVSFADTGISRLLGAWIPPYVGLRAKSLSYEMRPRTSDGCRIEACCELMPGGREVVFPCDRNVGGVDDFVSVVHRISLEKQERLANVRIRIVGSEVCEFEIRNLTVGLDDGSAYAVINRKTPRYCEGMKNPISAVPVRPSPARPRIQFGVGYGWYRKYSLEVGAIGDFMQRYLPEYDIVLSLDGAPEPDAAETMKRAPANVFFQYQKGRYDLRYAGLMDALIKNRKGKMQPQQFNCSIGTHPLLRSAYEDQFAYVGSVGINSVQQYDYVWYWPDAPWGFDAATIAAFREDLLEKDEGLTLVASGGLPERTIHFWNYYEDYRGSGSRLDPADVGFNSWDEFVSRYSTPQEKTLHWMLVTYEWLRHAQRLNEYGHRHCFGARHDYLLNAEGCVNGNDHVYLMRLKQTGVVSPEYFHFTPKQICRIYRSLGRLSREAKRCGKELGFTVETSCGGGSSQPYWSARTGYVICYALSALGCSVMEYDHLPDMPGALKNTDLSWRAYVDKGNSGLWHNLALGMADARGFRQAKLDGATKDWECTTLLLSQRNVAHRENREFENRLVDLNIAYERTDPQELPELLDAANTVFVSPSIERQDVFALLKRWQDAKAGRRLIMGGDNHALSSETFRRTQVASGDAIALPFRCRVGFAAVLFNRAAADKVDCEKWRKKIFPPLRKQATYDAAKLMYGDHCPDANAAVEMEIESGECRLYSVMDGRDGRVAVKDGRIFLPLGDHFCDLVYYGPDTKAFGEFLDRVKAERKVTAEFIEEE